MFMDNICHRIKEIINTKGVTTARFAEIIGVKQSTLSHTLNGRNKPSLDILMSISTTFPEISMDWLTKGNGEMLDTTLFGCDKESLIPVTDRSNSTEINFGEEVDTQSSIIDNNISNKLNDSNTIYNNYETQKEIIDDEEGSFPWDVALYAGLPYLEGSGCFPPNGSVFCDANTINKQCAKQRKIIEVKIFYDDHTFESFSPNKSNQIDE